MGTKTKPDKQAGIRKRMAQEVARAAARKGQPRPYVVPAGTRVGQLLERDYNSARIQVGVEKEGLRFNGKLYRTLGAIADEVTGRHVSGPAFFGLWTPPAEKKTSPRKPSTRR